MSWLYVFIGGGLGSMCRYGIARLLSAYKLDFPLATFVANILSCIILGFLIGHLTKGATSDFHKLLLMTGFCGGFSTFSTFSAESFKLLEQGMTGTALLYIGASIIVCLICIWVGLSLSRM